MGSQCAGVKNAIRNKSARKFGISSDKCRVKAGRGGVCSSRMRRFLTEASGEQEFEVEAELDEDQAGEAEKLVTSSEFNDAISSSVQSVAPGATADPISPDSISTEEVPDE